MRPLALLLLLATLAACSGSTGKAEAPACAGPLTEFLPDRWQAPDNAWPPGQRRPR
jgi:hypothetical protein